MGNRILFVDDDDHWHAVVGAWLEEAGYEVLTARDGSEAMTQTEGIEGCAREADMNVGASPTRRVGLFTTEHDLNSVAARRGWKLRKMNRRAVTKVNHI